MSKKINLKTWDSMEKLRNSFFSVICFASRKSGKSELIKYIYQKCDFGSEYDFVIVMSESMETLDFFSEVVHGNLFFNKFDNQYIDNIIAQSEKLESEGTKKKFLVIFDDVIGNDVKSSLAVQKLYAIGRHYSISCILIIQKLTLMSTTVRNNSDVIFIGRAKSGSERKSIIDNMFKGMASTSEIEKYGFKTKEDFYETLLNEHTSSYNFIVLDYTDPNNYKFVDVVNTFKADI